MRRENVIVKAGRKFKLNIILPIYLFVTNIFYFRGIQYGKLTSIKEILAGFFPNVDVLSFEKVRLHYSSPLFNDGLNKKIEFLEGKENFQYTLNIKDAIIYGDSNLIAINSKKLLYDMPVFDEDKQFKYTNLYTKIVSIKGNNVLYWKGLTHTLEKAIWMGGNFSWNYYHLLYEFIIKFLQLNTLDIPLDTPVLVDQICMEVPQYKELLDIANIKGYQLIGVERRVRVKAGNLIYISSPNFIPPNSAKNKCFADHMQFNISALHNLRNHFLPYSSQKAFPKRIFISRKNASNRRKFNEDAVIQLFSEFGFEVVFPETLSIPDQISLFSHAEWIVGGSGAAFANLLYCNSNCKVIIFTKAHFIFSGFSTIGHTVNVDLLYLTEEDTNKNVSFDDIHDAFELDLSYLRNFLIESGL